LHRAYRGGKKEIAGLGNNLLRRRGSGFGRRFWLTAVIRRGTSLLVPDREASYSSLLEGPKIMAQGFRDLEKVT
jgi:hypothetical protein